MSFGAPYMLFALLAVPALAGFVWLAFRRRAAAIRRIGEPALVALLSAAANGPMRRVRLALWFVGVVLLIVALARPQWGSDIEIVETRGLQIMVVLDISRSMLAADIEPTRLGQGEAGGCGPDLTTGRRHGRRHAVLRREFRTAAPDDRLRDRARVPKQRATELDYAAGDGDRRGD